MTVVNWGDKIKYNQYLNWEQDIKIEINEIETNLIVFRNNGRIGRYRVNKMALEVMSLIDGNKTFDDLIDCFSKKYINEKSEIEKKLLKFFWDIEKNYYIKVIGEKYKTKSKIKIEKSAIYPRAASLELTNVCNLRCKHCYGALGGVM